MTTKVLIVKTSALGDLVHVFPAIKAIKRHLPDAEIDWVAERAASPIARAHPDISEVIELDSKKWRKHPFRYRQEISKAISSLRKKQYDLLFDFQSNTKSALITLLANAKQKIGFDQKASEWPARFVTTLKGDPPDGQNIRQDYLDLVSLWSGQKEELVIGTKLCLSSEEEITVHNLLKSRSNGTNILVAPFSRWPNKQLLNHTMTSFLQKQEAVTFWIIAGNDQEKEEAMKMASALPSAVLVPKLTIPQLQCLMRGMDQVISVDSLALALAYEAKVPVFALFGSSSPQKYGLTNAQSQVFFGTCPYGKTFEKRCPILRSCKTGACLHDLSTEKITQDYLKS